MSMCASLKLPRALTALFSTFVLGQTIVSAPLEKFAKPPLFSKEVFLGGGRGVEEGGGGGGLGAVFVIACFTSFRLDRG